MTIRQQPSPVAQPIGQIPAATNIDIINLGCLSKNNGNGYSWCKLQWNGLNGWASADYLAVIETFVMVTTTATAEPETTETESWIESAETDVEQNILSLPNATVWDPSASRLKPERPSASQAIEQLVPVTVKQTMTLEYEAAKPNPARELKQKPVPPRAPEHHQNTEHRELENLRHPLPPFMGQPFYNSTQ